MTFIVSNYIINDNLIIYKRENKTVDNDKKQRINKCLMDIQKRDDGALDLLYDLVGHSMRFIALKYLRNEHDAEDLEQDFWSEIYNIADKFSYLKNGFSYLSRVMTNMAINRYIKLHGEKKYIVKYVNYTRIDNFDEDEVIKNMDNRAMVQKAFECLDPREQIVMQLLIFEDKKIVQIAKELKVSTSTVGRIKLSAEEKLKNQLDKATVGKKSGLNCL